LIVPPSTSIIYIVLKTKYDKERFKQSIQRFHDEGKVLYEDKDQNMWDVHRDDVADLLCVQSSLDEGDVEGAYRIASKLDTAIRDEIPSDVWAVLQFTGHCVHSV
jgi:hypothetical protein